MYSDPGTMYTDRKEREVKARLRRLYKQADEELTAKITDFLERHRARDEKYRRMVAEGKMAEEDYKAWLRGQVFQQRQWYAKREQIIREMTKTDQTARRIVDGEKLNIFNRNANLIGYELEREMNVDIGFELFDSSTVARLVNDDPDLLRPLSQAKIRAGKEIPFYQKTVTNAIAMGIMQGEGVDDIARRITTACAQRGENAAMRDARTAYTGAQNAGRVAGMTQAEKLGLKVKKLWLATFDSKTRDTHRDLDGETQETDLPFVTSKGNELMYPGDPAGAPEEVYNCRCTLGWSYDETAAVERIDNETRENVGAMTYREWEEWKRGAAAEDAEEPKTEESVVVEPENDEAQTEAEPKQTGIRVAKTREEAYDVLLNDVGFNEITDGIKYIDDQTVIEIANQLNELNNRFHAIGDDYKGYIDAVKSKKFTAAVIGSFTNVDGQNLVLSFDSFAHGHEKILRDTERGIGSGWAMPALREKYGVYAVTHEYGHILENLLIRRRVDMAAYEKEWRAAGVDPKKLKNVKAKHTDAAAKAIFREILDIAKKDNPDFSLRENISGYGRTNYEEAFAETFANSQLGQPNELGRAMNKWLEGVEQ